MLVIGLSCFCILLLLITCISLNFYVIGEKQLFDLEKQIRDIKEYNRKKCTKILTCKCCGEQYNFMGRYDFNFCSVKCDEECEL